MKLAMPSVNEDPRIAALLEEKWIKVPLFERYVNILEVALHEKRRQRPHCYCIIGDPTMGKTAIAYRLLKLYPPERDPHAEHDNVHILYVPLPEGPELGALLARMLRQLGELVPPRRRTYELREQVAALCVRLGVGLIIFDEFQHLSTGGKNTQARCRNLIKDFANDLHLPIVVMGIETARDGLMCDPQRTRFRELHLDRWIYNEDYLNLLVALERRAALANASQADAIRHRSRDLRKTGGLTGKIIDARFRGRYFRDPRRFGENHNRDARNLRLLRTVRSGNVLGRVMWLQPYGYRFFFQCVPNHERTSSFLPGCAALQLRTVSRCMD